MDESKYLELRRRLLEQAEAEQAHQEWMRRYVFAVAQRIDQQHGRQQRTCEAGIVRNGIFVADEFDAQGSKAWFAIQVKFHFPNGDELYAHAVKLNARIVDDVLRIDLPNTDDAVQMSLQESRTDEGFAKLMELVDLEVEATAGRALMDAKWSVHSVD